MLRIHVTGMTCGHCEAAVRRALTEVPGVERVVSVSRASDEAIVEGDPDAEAVVRAVEDEGYEARLV